MNVRAYFDDLLHALRSTEVTLDTGTSVALEDGVQRRHRHAGVGPRSGAQGDGHRQWRDAAIAGHIHNDLTKIVNVRASVFHETSILMALANDDGFETVFERQIRMWAETGDLLIAISSAGRSPNILRGVTAARDAGSHVVTMSGFAPDNPVRAMGHLNFYVPSRAYGFVEMSHHVIAHCITDAFV